MKEAEWLHSCVTLPHYGLLTNPSNEILAEIVKAYELDFEYVEVGIEGPEGHPLMIKKKKDNILNLLQKFSHKPIAYTPYWIDLCSDYGHVRHAWVLEARREIGIARMIEIDLINFHANLNGMFYGEKRKVLLDNMIKSLREIVSYAHKYQIRVMLENVPRSNGNHNIDEFKYIIDNVDSLFVHLD